MSNYYQTCSFSNGSKPKDGNKAYIKRANTTKPPKPKHDYNFTKTLRQKMEDQWRLRCIGNPLCIVGWNEGSRHLILAPSDGILEE